MIKYNKKHVGILFISLLAIAPLFYLPTIHSTNPISFSDNSSLKLSSVDGVNNYSIIQSVTYTVDFNLSLTDNSGSNNYTFRFPRLIDRGPDSPLTPYCPEYQESELLYNSITGSEFPAWTEIDEFNNTYDLFNYTSIPSGEKIELNQRYNITLNQITFSDVNDDDIGTYTPGDEIHNLYNVSEQYYDCTDPDLISAANSCGITDEDNPLEKAQKISIWVTNYLNYPDPDAVVPVQEIGASLAYDTETGDCSEFSSLMITLLRIHGIPARKMTGYLVSLYSNFAPYVGYSTTFTYPNFLGHAWVEYYIPNLGWIACEPQDSSSYKTSSYLRFSQNNGAWFDFPSVTNPENPTNTSEYNILYISSLGSDSTLNYTLTITVTHINLLPGFDWTPIITIAIIIMVVALVALVIYVIIKRTR